MNDMNLRTLKDADPMLQAMDLCLQVVNQLLPDEMDQMKVFQWSAEKVARNMEKKSYGPYQVDSDE